MTEWTTATASLYVDLRQWPGIVLQVSVRGRINGSNQHLDALIGRQVTGLHMTDVLDVESSWHKWDRIINSVISASGALAHASASSRRESLLSRWELVFNLGHTLSLSRTFSALTDIEDPTLFWLVEQAADSRLSDLTGRIETINAELTVTQRALMKEQGRLAHALSELQRTNRALDEFAHVVSHDLKAPLRHIAEYAELLGASQDAVNDPNHQNHTEINRIGVLAKKMRAMIDAVLQYARASRSHSIPEPFSSKAALEEIVSFLAPPRVVTIDIAPDLPVLCAERVPFDQVFRNLLSNAIKYRSEDGPQIHVAANDLGSSWEFVVEDNGPGIPQHQHERVWHLFHTTRPQEGSGVGLAIVKQVIEGQGGSITMYSEPGVGTRFHVQWPKAPPASLQSDQRTDAR